MYKYILKRLITMIPVIIGVVFVVFFIFSLTPGEPASMILDSGASPEAIEQLKEELGLNEPMIVQFFKYIGNLLRGNMGESYYSGNLVIVEIMARLPYTIKLALYGIGVSIVLSIPLGIISAVKQYSLVDNISMVLALIGVSMPTFWLGLMLILLFSVNLKLLPSGGAEGFTSIILPAVTVGFFCMGNITRTTRSCMLEVIRQDYIITAKAKGVSKWNVVVKHAFRNALIPIITVVGLTFGSLLGGAVLAETVFSWPGIGRLLIESIGKRDTPLILGCIVTFSLLFSIVNLLVDILYAYIDPRVQTQYK